jgi:hypothetical protein
MRLAVVAVEDSLLRPKRELTTGGKKTERRKGGRRKGEDLRGRRERVEGRRERGEGGEGRSLTIFRQHELFRTSVSRLFAKIIASTLSTKPSPAGGR